MTGPGPGKIPIDAIVEIVMGARTERIDAEVYIHVKGWSRAFVTHLDVEHPAMNTVVAKPYTRFFAKWVYLPIGLSIDCTRAIKPCILRIRSQTLSKIFNTGESDWCCIGGKIGGIYIGFRKNIIQRLENYAAKEHGIEPKKRTRTHNKNSYNTP